MADWYGNKSKGLPSFGAYTTSKRDEEFQEQDVWGVLEPDDSSISMPMPFANSDVTNGSSPPAWIKIGSTPRKSPPSSSPKLASAPVNVPDWSKIYGKLRNAVNDLDSSNDSIGNGNNRYNNRGGGEDDEEDDDLLAPHEWYSKKLAKSHVSSFSVCEGVGRTLKGRDLKRVRNTILIRTGFIE